MSPINYRSRLHGRDVLRAVRNRIVLHPHYFRDHSYYAGELHTRIQLPLQLRHGPRNGQLFSLQSHLSRSRPAVQELGKLEP